MFDWQGDLNDNCHYRDRGYVATCEELDEGVWFASAYRTSRAYSPAVTLLHTSSEDIMPKSGAAARKLCEMAIMADLYKERNA